MKIFLCGSSSPLIGLLLCAQTAFPQTPPADPAHITVQPTDATARIGDLARFSVVASGTGPLTYLWLRNDAPLPSSDGPEWVEAVASAAANGTVYRCVVANAAGIDTSAAATLHVSAALAAPRIIMQPDSSPVAAGDTAVFRISARGTAPLAFAWYRNGAAIPGAIDSTLRLFPVTWADRGAILTCRVTNAAGTAESRGFALKVVQPNGKTLVLQGELRDSEGRNLGGANGESMDMVVRFYHGQSGGAAVYEESFLAVDGRGVAVRDGRFSLVLGRGDATSDLSQVIQESPTLYVSFAIAKPGLTPEILEPRTPFTSAPYALSAPPARLKGASAPASSLIAPAGTLYEVGSTGALYQRTSTGWTLIGP